MYQLDLCHLGDHCAPGIIIDDILNIHKKTLFMLGVYTFNDIVNFLNDNNYENIYNKELLTLDSSNTKNTIHSQYNFKFNHDYVHNNSTIINYDLVRNRFDTKIKNFREMLATPTTTVFISFVENVDTSNIDGMVEWLRANKPNFHLMIFTNTAYTTKDINDVSILKIDRSYANWWLMDNMSKRLVYKEIYGKFIQCLSIADIRHDFPNTFEDTVYGKHAARKVIERCDIRREERRNQRILQRRNG